MELRYWTSFRSLAGGDANRTIEQITWCVNRFGQPEREWRFHYNFDENQYEFEFLTEEIRAEFILAWG